MAATLKPLKRAPSSSAWNFRGERNGYQFWTSRNGKTFAEDKNGNWFQVVRK